MRADDLTMPFHSVTTDLPVMQAVRLTARVLDL